MTASLRFQKVHKKGSMQYDRLMAIVGQATKRNESIGHLLNRLKALGTQGAELLGKVKKFVVA